MRQKILNHILVILILWKHRISLLVTFTAASAYILANQNTPIHSIGMLLIGVFLLSGGASCLNHWQEREYDRLMQRTKNRPLPQGEVTPFQTITLSIISIIIGTTILYLAFGWLTAVLGIVNIIWYNGLYTPLKRITPFAVIPGSLIGSMPALIGWSAANQSFVDPKIWVLAAFLFFWQIPHFWILLIKFADDYEKAGFASIRKTFNNEHIQWITFPWIVFTTIISLLFPIVGIITSSIASTFIVILNIGLILSFIWFVFGKIQLKHKLLRQAFLSINFYLMLVLLVITLNQILN